MEGSAGVPAQCFQKGGILMKAVRLSEIETTVQIILDFSDAFNRHNVAGMMHLMRHDCILEKRNVVPHVTCTVGARLSQDVDAPLGTCKVSARTLTCATF